MTLRENPATILPTVRGVGCTTSLPTRSVFLGGRWNSNNPVFTIANSPCGLVLTTLASPQAAFLTGSVSLSSFDSRSVRWTQGGTGHFPRHSLSAIQSRRDTAHSGQLTSHRQHTLTGSAMFIASRPSSGIGSQRVTKKHFSNYPSPNRTCHFHGIRLSSWLEVWTIVTTRPPVAPYFLPSTVAFRHTSGKVLSQLTRLSHFAL